MGLVSLPITGPLQSNKPANEGGTGTVAGNVAKDILGGKNIIGSLDDNLMADGHMRASQLIRKYTGWRGHDAIIARAVMGAESGYDRNAANACCVGLLQVNCDAHNGNFGTPKGVEACRKEMTKVAPNLHAAYGIFKAQGWDAWEGYTNGSYKKFMGKDPLITTNKNTLGEAASDVADVVTSPFKALAELVQILFSADTWFRVGKGFLGGILIVLGVGSLVFILANKVQGSTVGRAVKAAT